ncbi:MAG: polysaccharide deacetylase family protein [Anaerolineae bacterium]
MIDILAGLAPSLLLMGLGFASWRAVRGPAHGWKGRIARLLFTGLAAMLLVAFSLWQVVKSREVQLLGTLVNHAETTAPLVALTFDDGPYPDDFDEVLDVLRAEGVRATFYVEGQALEEHPELGRRLVAEGHVLGNHTYAHPSMVAVSSSRVRDEIERTDALIREAGYVGEITFRPPYGERLLALPYYLWRHGRTTVLWSLEPESYPEIAQDSARLREYVVENVQPGSIVLLHVMAGARGETRAALPGIIADLRARGYQFVTVPELLAAQG